VLLHLAEAHAARKSPAQLLRHRSTAAARQQCWRALRWHARAAAQSRQTQGRSTQHTCASKRRAWRRLGRLATAPQRTPKCLAGDKVSARRQRRGAPCNLAGASLCSCSSAAAVEAASGQQREGGSGSGGTRCARVHTTHAPHGAPGRARRPRRRAAGSQQACETESGARAGSWRAQRRPWARGGACVRMRPARSAGARCCPASAPARHHTRHAAVRQQQRDAGARRAAAAVCCQCAHVWRRAAQQLHLHLAQGLGGPLTGKQGCRAHVAAHAAVLCAASTRGFTKALPWERSFGGFVTTG
jgi:hypothetical protein